jgi:glyoxylase-like metal-dependent hydrolase (beta-lactamase superfamily II)/rhodanese-related sulfurtransferase
VKSFAPRVQSAPLTYHQPVHFHQFYLGCLAHASYLIGSNGEAAIVDPQRDVQQYIDAAHDRDLRIRYIIETHVHADFVSGHAELAERTGAEIVFGVAAGAEVPHRAVRDGDELRIGDVVLRALETPGHTPESISWLVIDTASDAPHKLLTGDTLFIGDVGRPDLAGSRGYTPEQMAALLYDSLHQKLLTLDDSVEVWPAHGAGSACGRNISTERSSTIGQQRRMNYALQPMSREAFVSMMIADLPPAPRYFPLDAEINRRGAPALPTKVAALSPAEVECARDRGAIVLDVRDGLAFGTRHVPGSINIGLRGQFASWAGTLIETDRVIVIVADDYVQTDEAVMRLARVGLENVEGALDGGIVAWQASGRNVATLPQLNVGELRGSIVGLQILDVRRRAEYESGHVPGALNVPLDVLPEHLQNIDLSKPTAVICASGYRSSAAASMLERCRPPALLNVAGGTAAWIAAGYETE